MKNEAALCAKMIKNILKNTFPDIVFSVKSQCYSGGDSVRVTYTNGVPTKEVEKWIRQFEYGTFDGMTDMYTADNNRGDIPQTKYLFVNREISQKNLDAIRDDIIKRYGMSEWTNESCQKVFNSWPEQVIWRETQSLSF